MQALLVLDVMNAIFELPVPLHDPDGFVERVRGLLDRARAQRVPVMHFRRPHFSRNSANVFASAA